MVPKNMDNILNIKHIEEKIFKYKSMYHPNLVANLSKEAYDLYLVRTSICDNLLLRLEKNKANYEEILQYIKKQIEESKVKLKNAKNEEESTYFKLSIQEWKTFLN
jgi:hypothetical protein